MRYARNGIGGRGSPQVESPNQGGPFASAVLETQTYGGPQFPRQQGRKHLKRNCFTPLGNRRSAGPDVPRMNSSRRTSLGAPNRLRFVNLREFAEGLPKFPRKPPNLCF